MNFICSCKVVAKILRNCYFCRSARLKDWKRVRKVYYEYDASRRVFRRIYPTFGQRIRTYLRVVLGVILLSAFIFVACYLLMPLLPQRITNRGFEEDERTQSYYQVLSNRIDNAFQVLHSIEQRDDNLYRVLLESEPLPEQIRQAGYNNTARYAELMELPNADLAIKLTQKVDLLEKKLYIQSRSFDEVTELYRDNEERIDCVPSIQPVANKDLKRTASGYGYRTDPIYHVRKFHAGMDFACPTGTPVYATGNGKVTYAKWKTGYGNCIEIDHGYGYVTRYAHLSKIDVKLNQTVARGEVIGKVGSTGKSTGAHLHYEVMVNGRNQNPVNYYFMDLDADEYDQMIQMAENQGRVYD